LSLACRASVPGATFRKVYSPFALVDAYRVTVTAAELIATVAPLTGVPFARLTTPVTVPAICSLTEAFTGAAKSAI
jgi:hypothetical protein